MRFNSVSNKCHWRREMVHGRLIKVRDWGIFNQDHEERESLSARNARRAVVDCGIWCPKLGFACGGGQGAA